MTPNRIPARLATSRSQNGTSRGWRPSQRILILNKNCLLIRILTLYLLQGTRTRQLPNQPPPVYLPNPSLNLTASRNHLPNRPNRSEAAVLPQADGSRAWP